MKKIFIIFKEVIKITMFSIRRFLCSIGVHDYVYLTEEHKTEGIKYINLINIRIRECTTCNKRWRDTIPSGGVYYCWKETNIKKDEIIELYENR